MLTNNHKPDSHARRRAGLFNLEDSIRHTQGEGPARPVNPERLIAQAVIDLPVEQVLDRELRAKPLVSAEPLRQHHVEMRVAVLDYVRQPESADIRYALSGEVIEGARFEAEARYLVRERQVDEILRLPD